MRLRLDLLFTDLSQRFGIYLVICANFLIFIHWHEVSDDLKSHLCRKIKSRTTTTQI